MRLMTVVRFGRPVRDVTLVPGGDLVLPAQQRPAQRTDLLGAGLVLEVMSETLDELGGEFRVVVVIDGTNHLLRVGATRCGPRRGGHRRRGGPTTWCGPARRDAHQPSSTTCGTGRAGRLCGPDVPSSRSGPVGGTRPTWCSRGGIGPGRGASVSAGPFPRPVPRTGRATSTASGSPRVPLGYATTVVVDLLHGVGIAAPR